MTNPFDLTPIMIECRAYVDAIADFKLETLGQTEYTRDAIIQYESHERIKILLTEFLLECEQKFSNSQLDLMQLLRRNRNHYQVAQGNTIKKLNELIERAEGDDLARYEDKRERFLNYFHHNYTLIDLILARLTNSPLSEHVQFKLKRVGLDWIVNSSQPLALLPQQLNEIDDRKTTKPRIDQMSSLTSCVSTFTDINFRVSLLSSFGVNLCKDRLDPTIVKQLKDFIHTDELNDLLAEFFASRNEIALQQTYAKVLIERLLNDWLPTIKHIERKLRELQDFQYVEMKTSATGELLSVTERDLSGPEFSAFKENQNQLWFLHGSLSSYNRRIVHHIRQFAPNLYLQYRDKFQEHINLKEHESILVEHESQLIQQPAQPDAPAPQPDVKGTKENIMKDQTITWNLSASVLYDVFAQLLKMTLPNGSTPISREGHTVKHLAAMIHQNIHFAKGNRPTLDQIERELQRMSAPEGIGAKRDKITIICKSEPDTE